MKRKEEQVASEAQENKVILVDCDDVLIDLLEVWLKALNETYGTNYTPDQVPDWDMTGMFEGVPKEQLFIPLHGEAIWRDARPKMGAVKWLRTLCEEGYDVYIVTATDYRNIKWKVEDVLIRYFSFIPVDHIITCYKKQMIKGAVLVDDYANNLIGGEYKKILFNCPHNRSFNIEGTDIHRASNWMDVYNLIHKFTD